MSKFIEHLPRPTGVVSMRAWRGKTLVEAWREHNLVVDSGRQILIRALRGDAGSEVTKIGFGTSDLAADVGDTVLVDAFIKRMDSGAYHHPSNRSVEFSFNLTNLQANGLAIMEIGLFSEDENLFARKVRSEPLNKTADLYIEGTWTITY